MFDRGARSHAWCSYRFIKDVLGCTVALTDANASVVQSYAYGAYGNVTSSGSSTNSYQYTGRENDTNGFHYYRARYYAVGWQRFLSYDPAGLAGGSNRYAYGNLSPLNYIDPSGLVVKVVEKNPTIAITLMNVYATLNARSAVAREMNQILEGSTTVLKIRATSDAKMAGSYCPSDDYEGCQGYANTIFVDPCKLPMLPTTAGMQKASLPIVLGHELGHAAYGYQDNFCPSDPIGDNVRMVENPIRSDFGLPLRTSYLPR